MDLENLWPEAKEALAGVAQLFGQHNTDGIDLYFLNNTKIQGISLKVNGLAPILDLYPAQQYVRVAKRCLGCSTPSSPPVRYTFS